MPLNPSFSQEWPDGGREEAWAQLVDAVKSNGVKARGGTLGDPGLRDEWVNCVRYMHSIYIYTHVHWLNQAFAVAETEK